MQKYLWLFPHSHRPGASVWLCAGYNLSGFHLPTSKMWIMLNLLLEFVWTLRILILAKCFEISELKPAQSTRFYLTALLRTAFTWSSSYGINYDHFNQYSFCNNKPAYINNFKKRENNLNQHFMFFNLQTVCTEILHTCVLCLTLGTASPPRPSLSQWTVVKDPSESNSLFHDENLI